MKTTVNNNNIESKNRVNNSRKQTKVAAAKLVGKTIHWSDRRKDGKPDALHEYSVKAVGECGGHTICLQTIKDGCQEHDLWLGFDVVETLASGKAVEIYTQHVQRSICIEGNKNQEFFTKGKKYRCIKSVTMKKGGETAFKAGNIYEQTGEPTHWVGWLRNERGERHGWPQPVYIADTVKTWGSKPEDIDPCLYFEPVEDIREAKEAAKEREAATLEPASEITASSEQGIKVGTEVWTTIELHPEYGKRGKVVRKFFADHGVWCLDIEFEDGTTACYAEEYVTTEKLWAVVGAKCHHKYLNRDVVLTITAVGHYYGIEAESEGGKVKRCGLVRDFEPVEIVTEAEGVKVGDKVRHNKHEEVATVTAIREAFVNGCDGYRYLYTLDFGQSVKGPFDVELNGGEFLREAFTICDPDGRKFRDFTTWNGVTVKAEERQQWTKIFADGIISKVKLDGGKSTYKHDAGFIAVRIAYRNGSDKPEDMSYCVSWYRWKDAEGIEAEIVECENGVSIWVAARAMADFHLLANKVGFATIDEILNPCKRPKVA